MVPPVWGGGSSGPLGFQMPPLHVVHFLVFLSSLQYSRCYSSVSSKPLFSTNPDFLSTPTILSRFPLIGERHWRGEIQLDAGGGCAALGGSKMLDQGGASWYDSDWAKRRKIGQWVSLGGGSAGILRFSRFSTAWLITYNPSQKLGPNECLSFSPTSISRSKKSPGNLIASRFS